MEIECGLCGRDGGSYAECNLCHGRGENVKRQYTLSDEQAGRAPRERRYGSEGQVGPRIVNLPGCESFGTN